MTKAALRPKDAATLIIVRDKREVLLGLRSARHRFLPNHYVFPGGGVDPGDARVKCPIGLKPSVAEQLQRSCSAARARALAMTAVRETFEETGLLLGESSEQTIRSQSPSWQPIFQQGVVPALHRLEYLARAITPPNNVRRFDARFFMVDSKHMQGSIRSNGELEDLRWVALDEVDQYPLISITRLVLELLQQKLQGTATNPQAIPLFRQLHGQELIEHH
ncbi:NUDIX hydrolase [Parahaliea sp. F7430]|uniref:NUDIX hydrolase n=1 Tax=Sediminihaliea albiluteola TaxID=2758564 RepID=A0A7W2YID6_9GAMM|nr:NUDIX hydrolase [Sediminihaliea albiluteola]MBA6411950.1 NUDIX hydrolase [Sediminihaliea albiluteola]